MVRHIASLIFGSFVALSLWAEPAGASDIPDAFPLRQTVGGTNLVLNGYGVRERLFRFPAYR